MSEEQILRAKKKVRALDGALEIMYNATTTTHVVSAYSSEALEKWKTRNNINDGATFCTLEQFEAVANNNTSEAANALVLRRKMSPEDYEKVKQSLGASAITPEFTANVDIIVSSWQDAALLAWMRRMAVARRLPKEWSCRVAKPSNVEDSQTRVVVDWVHMTTMVPFVDGSRQTM